MLPRPLGGALRRRGGKQIPAPPNCLSLNLRLWLVLVFPTHCYSISFIGPQFPSVAHTHACTHACLHARPLSRSPSEKETEALPLRIPVSFKPTILTCLHCPQSPHQTLNNPQKVSSKAAISWTAEPGPSLPRETALDTILQVALPEPPGLLHLTSSSLRTHSPVPYPPCAPVALP